MTNNLLYEILQNNYASISTLLLFVYIIKIDTLISRRVQRLFFKVAIIIFIMKIVTLTDVALSSITNPCACIVPIRRIVNVLYFSLPPVVFIYVTNIFDDISTKKWYKYYILPEIINLIICSTSLFNNTVYYVTKNNEFIRGPLYALPYIFAAFYYLFFFYVSASQEKKQSVKVESIFLIIVFFLITIAIITEIITHTYFILWKTTYICIILYFLLINIHTVLYDSLSDAYTRLAFSGFLERHDKKEGFTIAMIDINNLKDINDKLGHLAGDKVVERVAFHIIKNKQKGMSLFRYGGDEFVLTAKSNQGDALKRVLDKAHFSLGYIENMPVSFAYGISEYSPSDDLHALLNNVDKQMYENKQNLKKQTGLFE